MFVHYTSIDYTKVCQPIPDKKIKLVDINRRKSIDCDLFLRTIKNSVEK